MWAFPILAVFAGAAITLQAGMNARLGVLFKNPLLATAIAFLMACIFTLIFMVATHRQLPIASDIKAVPTYLWFGGILSAFGVGSYYYLIPKMGVGSLMSFALSGQLILAVIAGHFGWFEQPIKPITMKTIVGLLAMVLGIIFINGGTADAH
ncbi:DMT family transporter [Alteromonas sp. 009811495]|uniref:DMT family transporter n=1 Tax=Alteromonas sp. 009811495 TaxID=3002962 RepID=UPI00237E8D35|nr:DMT family transporter [Alteromonas sp. 009811495]WDT84694.1 DMT family transporter [Alteromonas sp. 009811495]